MKYIKLWEETIQVGSGWKEAFPKLEDVLNIKNIIYSQDLKEPEKFTETLSEIITGKNLTGKTKWMVNEMLNKLKSQNRLDANQGSTAFIKSSKNGAIFKYMTTASYAGQEFDVTLKAIGTWVGVDMSFVIGLVKPKSWAVQQIVNTLIPEKTKIGEWIIIMAESKELKTGLTQLWNNNGDHAEINVGEGVRLKLKRIY